MKYRLFWTLGLVALGAVALATGPAQAQTTAPGPYYATPSWDQTIACTTTANCPRFIVLSNMGGNAVLDRETGLVWERSPSQLRFDWFGAQSHCNNLSVGNRKGWRLPTVQELASLVDPTAQNPVEPTLPAGHPFRDVFYSLLYWSATTSTRRTSDAWGLYFVALGGSLSLEAKDDSSWVAWCVRGGQGVDPQ